MSRTKKDLLEGITKEVLKSRKIANNTLEIWYKDNSRAIRLHNTDVITFINNTIVLNSGTWRTPTTKDRINKYSGLKRLINQDRGIWYINGSMFYDGIVLDLKGNIISKILEPDLLKIAKIKRQITNFCNFITVENLPLPDNGDCWYCLMKEVETGKSLGDCNNNHDHLISHLKEGYLHGSLLVNAMLEAGYRNEQIGFHYQLKCIDTFKRTLRRYLQKRLIKDIAVK